jgi:small-conductance mechanosensitive channel
MDLAASLRTLQVLQTAPPTPNVPADEATAASERARMEAINIAQAFATFQQLSADLNAGLEATQQLDAEVQHILLQVRSVCVPRIDGSEVIH